MIRAFSIDDVRVAEEAVKGELEPGELMQRAALGLAEVARARSDEDDRVVVLAGSGDNGADALYAAAHRCWSDRAPTKRRSQQRRRKVWCRSSGGWERCPQLPPRHLPKPTW